MPIGKACVLVKRAVNVFCIPGVCVALSLTFYQLELCKNIPTDHIVFVFLSGVWLAVSPTIFDQR